MKKELVSAGLIALVFVVGWAVYDNQQYFKVFNIKRADASSHTKTATLSASVAAGAVQLNISSGTTVSFGIITSGTQKYSATGFNVLANDTINVSFGRDRATPAHALASSAAPATYFISDSAGGLDVFTGCASSVAQPWLNASSTGLGFSLYVADENKNTTCWGTGVTKTDSSNKYAALQASDSGSTAWTSTTVGSTIKASVGWIVDVSSLQAATSYTGDVILTAVVTP